MVIYFCKDDKLRDLMAAELVASKEDQEIVKQSPRDKVSGFEITDRMEDLFSSIVFLTVGREGFPLSK